MRKLPEPAGERPRRRRRTPTGGTSSRRTERRAEPETGTANRLLRDIDDRLGALMGYCELAQMKNESGEALRRRMDAAIDTVVELSSLIEKLGSV